MSAIIQVAKWVMLGEMPYVPGVYVIVEGTKARDGEVTRKAADLLLKAHPDSVKEFKDNEPIANLLEWKKQNTVIKS